MIVWHSALWAILRKEALSLRRTRQWVAAEAYFVVGAVLVVLFAFPPVALDADVRAGLVWVVLYFAAMMTVARSYTIEQDRGTLLYLMHTAPSDAVYWGKLASAIVWVMAVGLSQWLLMTLVGLIPFAVAVAVAMLAGCAAIGGATSLLAAIVAATQMRGWVFAAIAFPIVLPILFLGVETVATALAGGSLGAIAPELGIMLLYMLMVSVVAWLLFPFVWSQS
ncbi:MAG: cytochrome C biogenesis protein CcmB [Candidatus Kapaibacterium sp.]|nr:MAG: cytochrome C biogenesis protein CcmB [Candidatus Kapabacteria bacterium]